MVWSTIFNLIGAFWIGIGVLIAWSIVTRYRHFQSRKFITAGLPKIKSVPILHGILFRLGWYEAIVKEMVDDPDQSSMYDFGTDLTGEPLVAVTDPDIFREILNNPEIFPKQTIHSIIGNGLVFAEGEHWRKQRKRLTPAFNFGALHDAVDYMVDEADELVNKLGTSKGMNVDAPIAYSSVTLRVIIRYAFGGAFDIEWMEETWINIMKNFAKHFLIAGIFGAKILPYLPFAKAYHLSREVGAKGAALVEKRRITEQVTSGKNDITGILMDCQREEQDITDDVIVDEAKTFLLAGHETTANLLAWASYQLSIHPDVQEKAFQEVNQVMQDRRLSSEDISKLKYVRAILDETLRVRPVSPTLIARQCTEPVTFKGREFPVGTRFVMWVAIPAMRASPGFEDPKAFLPERWLEQREERHPYAYLPFSAGPRNCIGKKFGLQEAIIILAMTIRKLQITSSGKPQCHVSPTLIPNGITLHFAPREKSSK
eukprot:TRINITY_DN10999_c0_g1_i1.p1 TRINITY_DN10999_c0_g1~~TRINITY_DN10999_c0_g1_i1.p1  ORF type:complete len:485 (-),score=99.75 TRINITY_DN10999_c0_g1_i1:27-1481(-)